MTNKKTQYLFVAIISCFCTFSAIAQITTDRLRLYIADKKYKPDGELNLFYSQLKFKTAWIKQENTTNRQILFDAIAGCNGIGLKPSDYESAYLSLLKGNMIKMKTADDSLEAELSITEAGLHFYNDLAHGNTKPELGYNGLKYSPDCESIAGLMAEYIAENSLHFLSTRLSPPLKEIRVIENKIRWLQAVMAATDFREITITSNKISAGNKPLIAKLYQLQIIDSALKNKTDSITLKQKIREAQMQFCLLSDGVLRSTILKELNVPVSQRLRQLILSVNYYRWLYCLVQRQPVIVVNIPATVLKVHQGDQVILEMRMIVGKKSTPTPTLLSKVDEVVLYPYWHVPYKIATRELLPSVKRNPGFINSNNYQVLNKSGKIIDPYSINWHRLSAGYFPYLLRQSTGCDNALGLLKLDFYNPFAVYLHDTPNKNLFSFNKRYFSHGCMRMENPTALGHLVLNNNAIAIDTLEQKGCLRNIAPIKVDADVHMPVLVWYNPAGIDSSGRVLFFEDVYGKFEWMKNR